MPNSSKQEPLCLLNQSAGQNHSWKTVPDFACNFIASHKAEACAATTAQNKPMFFCRGLLGAHVDLLGRPTGLSSACLTFK